VVEPEADSSSAETPEVESTSSEVEEAVQPEGQVEAQPEEAPVEASQVEATPVEWPNLEGIDDLSSLDLSSLGEGAQAFASSLVERVQKERLETRRAHQEFSEAKEMFQRLAAGLEDNGNAVELAQEVEVYRGGYNYVAQENTVLATELFKTLNPDYAKAPPDLKESFAKEVEVEGFYSKWTDGHLAKKMTDAWVFLRSKAGWTPPKTEDTQRAALVETGHNSGGYEDAPVEQMSTRDILSRHDHLLA
tara:strand:- start:4084 stop:4827 length:744 start_codon:yes stop_codon:yes gene_type:complete